MSIVSQIRAKTTGAANELELERSVLWELPWRKLVKNSKIILACQSDYGFWRWKDVGHTQKEHCNPGDWIIIDGTSVSFKDQANFNASAYGEMIPPNIDEAIIY